MSLAGFIVLVSACSGRGSNASLNKQASVSNSTTTTFARCTNASVISSWSLTRRAEQLIVVPVEETDVAGIAPAVQDGVGGIILYGPNAPTDLASQLSTLKAHAPGGLKPIVMTDEEGGEVQRMANLVGSLPSAATMAVTMSVSQVQALATSTARAMAANGVTMDLAPVLDLAAGSGSVAHPTDGPRSFSIEPSVTTPYGIAFARGLRAGGVIPVVKDFPGEGSATANTDAGPASTPPIGQLERADILPFEAAIKAGLPAVMVGNASVPGLTSRPASLSPSVIEGLLEHQLGFHGLVLTDALSAGAITDLGLSLDQASVEAIAAGADMILYTSDNAVGDSQAIAQALVAAVKGGTIPLVRINDAVARVLAAKDISLCTTAAPPG